MEIPEVEELDFSGVQANERLVRYGVKEVLGGLRWIPESGRETVIKDALADRAAFVETLMGVLRPNVERFFGEADNELSEVAEVVAGIVLGAFEKQLEE